MPRLKHLDSLGTPRFITFTTFGRQKLLCDSDVVAVVLRSIELARKRSGFSVLGYVIMPDHVHLVIHPREGSQVGYLVGSIKQKSGFEIISRWKRHHPEALSSLVRFSAGRTTQAFWQPRCYDHNCRTLEVAIGKIRYCHSNPVRAGLVSEAKEWPWSSHRWYAGDRSGIVAIDDRLL